MTATVVLLLLLNLTAGVLFGKLDIWLVNKLYKTFEERVENLVYQVKVDCGIVLVVSLLGIFPTAVHMLLFKYVYIASLDLKKVLSQ